MEYNSNATRKPEWFKGCNKQQWMWNGIDQNKILNHININESKNFLGGSFWWQH